MTPDPAARIARECVAVRARLLGRVVTRVYDAALRPHGLTAARLNILAAVGSRRPVTAAALARGLALDKSTLSRDLRPLLAAGWVATSDGDDRRSAALSLTPAGSAVLAAALPAWEAAQAEVRRRLGTDATAGLFAAADRVWEGV